MREFIFILFCLTYFATSADANPRVFIFHVNGVNTTEAEAKKNSQQLLDVAKIDSNIITWDYLYNPTHGLLPNDLWDVFRQKREEKQDLTIDDYVVAYMKAHNLSYPVNSNDYKNLKDHIKEAYAKDLGYVGYNFDTILQQFHDKTPNKLAASVVNLLNSQQDRKQTIVLLIAHSQGVLYANALHNYLVQAEDFPDFNIGIFGIASPADRITTGIYPAPEDKQDILRWPYVTADNDFVINSLRGFSFFPPQSNQPLPGTIHLKTCNDSNICHGLVDAYLADPIGADVIARKINLYLYEIEQQLKDKQNALQIILEIITCLMN